MKQDTFPVQRPLITFAPATFTFIYIKAPTSAVVKINSLPKMNTSYSLQLVNVLPYKAVRGFTVWLSKGSWDREITLNYTNGARFNHKPSYMGKRRVRIKEGNVTMEDVRKGSEVEEGAVSQGQQTDLRSWKTQGDGFASGASRGDTALLMPWFRTLTSQKNKMINSCCFKPLHLW